jgi:hypothetical protein
VLVTANLTESVRTRGIAWLRYWSSGILTQIEAFLDKENHKYL